MNFCWWLPAEGYCHWFLFCFCDLCKASVGQPPGKWTRVRMQRGMEDRFWSGQGPWFELLGANGYAVCFQHLNVWKSKYRDECIISCVDLYSYEVAPFERAGLFRVRIPPGRASSGLWGIKWHVIAVRFTWSASKKQAIHLDQFIGCCLYNFSLRPGLSVWLCGLLL